MSQSETELNLRRRFRPLLLANFLQELIFWYGIEKLFMTTIGFNSGTIAVAISISTVTILLAQMPTGILADRWSRKGVLMLASIVLLLTSFIGGTSHSIGVYVIASGLWGVYYAMRSGIFDAVVYDVLLEETGKAEGFEHYFGQQQMANSAALVSSSLLSGVIASSFGLRLPYFLVIPFTIASMIALMRFREPTLHRRQKLLPLGHHLKLTLQAIFRNSLVLWLVVTAVAAAAAELLLFQFTQLWWITLAVPVVFFGPFHAMLNASIGLSGPLSRLLKRRRSLLFINVCAVIVLSLVLQLHIPLVIAIAQTGIITGLMGAGILLNHWLHDSLPSNIRSGTSSTVGALTQLIYVPVALLFGHTAETHTIFGAAWIVIVLSVFVAFGVFVINRNRSGFKLEEK
jgi:MFS family permease